MALNLSKHGSEMQRAWKQVCDANESTDWALYGYEGKKNNLLARAQRFGITAKGCLNACTVKRTPIHCEEDHCHREQDCLRHDQLRAQNVLQTKHMPLSPVCCLSVCRSVGLPPD